MSESATRLGESRVSSEAVEEEIPAHGSENVMEWKEGDCVVIERRCGPAEEVSAKSPEFGCDCSLSSVSL